MNKNAIITSIKELENASFSQVVPFIKKNSYFSDSRPNSCSELFWHSNLPIKWFKELINEPYLEELLFAYFSRPQNANLDFIKLFINSKYSAELIRIIKLSEAFKMDSHWITFSVFVKSNDLKVVYKELDYIRAYRQYWKNETVIFENKINEIDYEDILIQMISYFEHFKRYSKKTVNNTGLITSYKAHLINILDIILNIKKRGCVKNKIKNKYSSINFKKIAKEQLPPIRAIESLNNQQLVSNEKIDKQKKTFRELVEFFFAKDNSEYQIQKYLSGLAEFEMIENLEAELLTNTKYCLYRKTLEKGIYDEVYFTNKVIENEELVKRINEQKEMLSKQLELSIYTSIEYFKYLKIPVIIDKKNTDEKIDLEKVLILLKSFSLFLMPQGRTIINNEIVFKNKVPQKFEETFDIDYLVSFEENELVEKCHQYFEWSKDEIQIIIEYLTTDLTSHKIDVQKRPLIKIGNQYIWLSSFLKDTRWEIILHRKIVKENSLNLSEQPIETEKYISEIFKKAKFGSISSHVYKNKNVPGEIDILAFKENTLFILELKSTYIGEDIMKTSKYEVLKFNSKASEQLNLAKDYIINNYDEIKKCKNLGINCELKDLKIVTIIISNIYQSDNLIFRNEHHKISLFELMIILKNDLYNMLVQKECKILTDEKMDIPVNTMLQIENKSNLKYSKTHKQINEDECSLWKENNSCSANDLTTAILESKVWKHQAELKQFTRESIKIQKFNKNHRFLS
ncbi:hypothetical protein FIA58_000295 [Flavobacterium jejuense]|uniref:NERD domain-containing protein n=1 Tax=Flavobacterium jejuense TaxID=1544455 RepID=A0ABX0IPP6_9FLAO|nr:hypothetical protein [Flavobacterium jejuense]NHN24101.1 hypothetical protein [Flavobacterium jejuense]